MTVADRFVDEKLNDVWCVDENKESFIKFLNHILLTSNFKIYFEKALNNQILFNKSEGIIVADIGAGTGWSSAIMALKPEISKVYVLEPSENRLKIAPEVAKHFGAPKEKLEFINGSFTNLSVPEKVDLVVMSGSLHHCFDKDMSTLFNNIRKILAPKSEYKYKNFQSLDKKIVNQGKILIANEHYLDWLVVLRRKLSWIKRFGKPSHGYGPGHWNDPDPWSSEHNRTKKELEIIFKREGFKADFFNFDGSLIDRAKIWKKNERQPLTYYYAILESL